MPTSNRKTRKDAGTKRPLTTQEEAIRDARLKIGDAQRALDSAIGLLNTANQISPNTDNRRRVMKKARR